MLDIDEKTRNKKEISAECPFCVAESKKDKFYLSLNPEKNVFKCWFCKKYGDAIQFESLLENEEYQNIYKKYFSNKKRKNKHPVFNLTPDQLIVIDWQKVKVEDFETFKKRKNEVLRHCRIYEYEEMTKLYALFLLTVNFDHDYKMAYQQWFVNKVNEYIVSDVIKKIKSDKQTKWKEKGKDVARKVYKVTSKEDSP